ncbi:response regulator transcription factor [Solidesulfovibrio sp.]|uniref:response regulator n=1 Tax=Solidesulfovibrio sp. TaxID=2910990 RepID=UPI002618BBFA|nr:response regulator transcription factor [Solidesulfovibrio sp.]
MSEALKVLLVDDHPLFREGLRAILGREAGYTVVGEAGTAAEALRLAAELAPDVVLLDVGLPDAGGIEAIGRLRALAAPPKVLVVSMHARLDIVAESMRAGAMGYVVKDSAAGSLLSGLAAVSRGERYLDGAIAPQLLDRLDAYASRRARPADPAYETLTRREQQVLRLLAEGRNISEIAAGLYISRKTVENHRSNIFGKLGLTNLAELVHYAARMGLVDLEGEEG